VIPPPHFFPRFAQGPETCGGLIAAETKKPAAGGGAAGFSKITEQQLGGGVLLFPQTALGGVGRLHIELMREEVHRFDRWMIHVLAAY